MQRTATIGATRRSLMGVRVQHLRGESDYGGVMTALQEIWPSNIFVQLFRLFAVVRLRRVTMHTKRGPNA
jgi:hypothetical protein